MGLTESTISESSFEKDESATQTLCDCEATADLRWAVISSSQVTAKVLL
jgi:hypothetical protein